MDTYKKMPRLFWQFFQFGCFTFGGGWSIIAQMQKLYEAVKSRIGDGEAVFLSSDRNLLKAMRRVLDAAGDSRISLQILIRSADELPLWEYQELGVTPVLLTGDHRAAALHAAR